MSIDPNYWLRIASERAPKSASVTDWYCGHMAPVHHGWYERHFTDGTYFQYWDGIAWRMQERCAPHWRQVGDYPAWRGLKSPALHPDGGNPR
jgi:hypothetical protein